MAKVKQPLFSLGAARKLGDDLVYKRGKQSYIVEKKPEPKDARSVGQLSWRHMFQKVVALWHALSAAEKEAWESLARPKHMTGYAWFVSQALRPNPGIYLPLQGGIMQGIIDMAGYEIQGVKDPVLNQDADTKAAREAAIAAALEDCIDSHIHGWDGTTWQKLKVESVTEHNLRVGIWYGPLVAKVVAGSVISLADADKGLIVNSRLYGCHATGAKWYELRVAGDLADGYSGSLSLGSMLWGYNGASWDRLRSYGTGILKVGRAEIGLSTLRRVGAGQVKASPGTLYWMKCNPSAGNSIWELSDDLDGSTAIVIDTFHTNKDGHMVTFDPPMEFSTGIYLKTFTNMTSITFGYK